MGMLLLFHHLKSNLKFVFKLSNLKELLWTLPTKKLPTQAVIFAFNTLSGGNTFFIFVTEILIN